MSIDVRAFELRDTEEIVSLWQAAGLTRPWNDPYQDIRRKLTVQPELFLVAADDGAGGGAVRAGDVGPRGGRDYHAAAPARRGEGIARRLVAEAEERLIALGCPKVQLMVRPENGVARGFYAALGYEPFETWATGKRLIAD